jgi:hypothetical protein
MERLQSESTRRQVVELLRFADLGIQDLTVTDHEMDEEVRSRIARVMEAIDPKFTVDDEFFVRASQTLRFTHRTSGGENAVLDLASESDGTRTWLALLGPILAALEHGSVLLVDELDSSLHPRLSSEIIRMFHDRKFNAAGAQLIFNTHDPSLMGALLGDAPLRRDEVWLTEKDRDGVTHLYPLTEFRPRKAENLERGYLQGRYGGVPFIDRDFALAALSRRESDEIAPNQTNPDASTTSRNSTSSAEIPDSVRG